MTGDREQRRRREEKRAGDAQEASLGAPSRALAPDGGARPASHRRCGWVATACDADWAGQRGSARSCAPANHSPPGILPTLALVRVVRPLNAAATRPATARHGRRRRLPDPSIDDARSPSVFERPRTSPLGRQKTTPLGASSQTLGGESSKAAIRCGSPPRRAPLERDLHVRFHHPGTSEQAVGEIAAAQPGGRRQSAPGAIHDRGRTERQG